MGSRIMCWADDRGGRKWDTYDDEDGESVSGSNGKAVDTELELTDSIRGILAAGGEDEEASTNSFAKDDDDGTSGDKEVTLKRSFQAYEHGHHNSLNVLVCEPAPSSTPLSSTSATCNVKPPGSRPVTGPCAESPLRGSHRMTRTSRYAPLSGVRSGELERENEKFLKASAGAGDGAGTTTSLRTGSD
ncbi:hypothetical protein EDB87DRAFT_1579787 [Lactarius vividus]|nr:hypothetical protein EDB87DRAFT_1579787 [Lactarius vividus]